jgi:GMC oxidoreductase
VVTQKITDPGRAIHEMGAARMGRDPKTSVLNSFNQTHVAKNLFVTDGTCVRLRGFAIEKRRDLAVFFVWARVWWRVEIISSTNWEVLFE